LSITYWSRKMVLTLGSTLEPPIRPGMFRNRSLNRWKISSSP
jgi:hypothetical protein